MAALIVIVIVIVILSRFPPRFDLLRKTSDKALLRNGPLALFETCR
jgi:hypothetical protein